MKKGLLIILYIAYALNAFPQQISLESNFLGGTNDQLPFWLWANQLGRYQPDEAVMGAIELQAGEYYIPSQSVSWNWGARVNGDLSNQSSFFFSELYGKLQWKFLQLSLGKWAEDEQFDGLSISNGNISYSRNARPHPRIRIGTNGFQYFVPAKLAVSANYEEGLLNDQRYVDQTHLHHKNLLIKYGILPGELEFTLGLYHYVMWGGMHPSYGKLPGWEDYFRYVTGSSGGPNAIITDQENVLGNQYGNYLLQVDWHLSQKDIRLYLSHPFEDHSGMELVNIKDNLYGLSISSPSGQSIIQTAVLEYFYTKHQSGDPKNPDGSTDPSGADNYLNNSVYQAATYHDMVMGAPFFGFITTSNNKHVLSNRVSGFNLGLRGSLKRNYNWRCQFSNFKNLGNYSTRYQPARKQFSSLAEIRWKSEKIPLSVGVSAAIDNGQAWDNGKQTTRTGGKITISYRFD